VLKYFYFRQKELNFDNIFCLKGNLCPVFLSQGNSYPKIVIPLVQEFIKKETIYFTQTEFVVVTDTVSIKD